MSEFENKSSEPINPEIKVFEPVNDVALEALLRLVEITKKVAPERVSQLFSPEDPERKFIERLIKEHDQVIDSDPEQQFVKQLDEVISTNANLEIDEFDEKTEKLIANDPVIKNLDAKNPNENVFARNPKEEQAEKIKKTRNRKLEIWLGRIASTFYHKDDNQEKLSA